ncbi:MAG: helix-turn-helix transcriptional regulator, partial [Defluviitaleaceae bacterium]|nr:helix-turn-helix transcriptional regulator [Defluviitaleaceae bacterium]
ISEITNETMHSTIPAVATPVGLSCANNCFFPTMPRANPMIEGTTTKNGTQAEIMDKIPKTNDATPITTLLFVKVAHFRFHRTHVYSILPKHFAFVNSEYTNFRRSHIINLEVAILNKTQLKEMATRIKTRRESLGYTQERFCEVINLSASSYTKIENAFQQPSLDTLIKIAQHLDLSLDYIVFGGQAPQDAENFDYVVALLKIADSDKLLHASNFLSQMVKALS